MSNGRSQRKGKVGELDVVHKLGGSAKRIGHSYIATPVDVETNTSVWQVRNKTIGGSEIALELGRLHAAAPQKDSYIAFKVKGKWYVAESFEQHKNIHGEGY